MGCEPCVRPGSPGSLLPIAAGKQQPVGPEEGRKGAWWPLHDQSLVGGPRWAASLRIARYWPEGRGLVTVVNVGRPGPSALGCPRARRRSGS